MIKKNVNTKSITMVIIRGNKTAMHEYQKESKRGASNLLDEMIYSIVVFKINVFFVLYKGRVTK